jgi:uncharacterized phosphosugar-binding protein
MAHTDLRRQGDRPHPYVRGMIGLIEQGAATQRSAVESVAEAIVEAVQAGGVVHVFGTGHSHIVAEELAARAAGPLFVHPILDESLMLHTNPGLSTRTERLTGYAEVVLDGYELRREDVFIVASNSGRNPVPIEAVTYAKERGLTTVAVTSVAHSQHVASRHASGKKLMDVADIVIDTGAPVGDGQLHLASGEEYGPTSTALAIILCHTVICLVVEELERRGEDPPLLRSANLDGSDEINEARRSRYPARMAPAASVRSDR